MILVVNQYFVISGSKMSFNVYRQKQKKKILELIFFIVFSIFAKIKWDFNTITFFFNYKFQSKLSFIIFRILRKGREPLLYLFIIIIYITISSVFVLTAVTFLPVLPSPSFCPRPSILSCRTSNSCSHVTKCSK